MRHDRPAPPVLVGHQAVRDAIGSGRYRILTSDVFDTLVWRPAAKPHHLWGELGRVLSAAGDLPVQVTAPEFAMARVRAEARARVLTGVTDRAPEVTIEEIWRQMPTQWLNKDPDAYVTAELAFEARVLRRHDVAIECLALARSVGMRVVLVSDTYLHAGQLTALLAAAGVPSVWDDVVVSSEHRRSKADGLLQAAIERSGVAADQVLHIGDHPVSDVAAAARCGATAVQLALPAPVDAVSHAHRPFDRYSEDHASDGGRGGALRDAFNEVGLAGFDPSFQFGAAVAAPLAAGFCGWASATAASFGSGTVHCLLREGGTIAEVMREVAPQGPRPVTLHASRWAVLRAAVFTGTEDELFAALARRADLVPEHVAAAFDVDVRLVRDVIGAGPHDHRTRALVLRKLAAHTELRGQIIEASTRLRRNAQRYLEHALELDDGPIVLCDVGWSGMIQHGLTDIIHDMGIDREVVGLYCATTVNAEERVSRGATMKWYLPTSGLHGRADRATGTIVRYPELLERILTPPIGTLLSFDDDGRPVCKPDTEHRSVSLEAAQTGLATGVRHLGSCVRADPARWCDDLDFRTTLAESMASVLQSPDARVADPLLGWEHDDVAGSTAEGLGASWIAPLLPFANAFDIDKVPPTEVFWLPGMAALGGGALAAQLDAVERGADSSLLCPVSPLGVATITVFPRRSPRAAAMWSDTPRVNPDGWSTLTYRCTVPTAGAVTLQLCPDGGVVEFGLLRVELQHGDTHEELSIDHVDHDAVNSVLARRLGRSTLGFAPGGHLRVSLPAMAGDAACVVRVSVAYRGIGAEGVDPSLVGPSALRQAPRRAWMVTKEWLRGPARRVSDALRSLRTRMRR